MNPPNPILTQGTWKVGRGFDIPFNHPNWFQPKPDAHNLLIDQVIKVVDLINQDTATWKAEAVMHLYDKNTVDKILGIPLPKIQCQTTQDQIIWPHSNTGNYQVKTTYALLH